MRRLIVNTRSKIAFGLALTTLGAAMLLAAHAGGQDQDTDPSLRDLTMTAPDWDETFATSPSDAEWARGFLPMPDLISHRTLPTNHERQLYFDGPYLGHDLLEWKPGSIKLVARRMTATDHAAVASRMARESLTPAAKAMLMVPDWASTLLVSRRPLQYGYFETRMRITNQVSAWPAFWMAAHKHVWPPEIDILEVPGDNIVHQTIHSMPGDPPPHAKTRIPLIAGFHTYGVLWGPDMVRLYIDRHETLCVATPPDMHQPMHVLLNLAVGGWAKAPDANTPEQLETDVSYVKWWHFPPNRAPGRCLPDPAQKME